MEKNNRAYERIYIRVRADTTESLPYHGVRGTEKHYSSMTKVELQILL